MDFYIETLGCARNRVDSEVMLARLLEAGFSFTSDPSKASVIVVNTCSFVDSAVNESVDTILELSQFKKDGLCKSMIVVGCLPERFRDEIVKELPEVDFFLGTGAFDRIVLAAKRGLNREKCILPDPNSVMFHDSVPRKRRLPHAAYVKIAEGCNYGCSYCIIPKLRGKYKSRPLRQIINETEDLIATGVKEITLVAQDTTNYGRDLPGGLGLNVLLTNLATLSKNVWVRFLYGHPDTITEAVIETVAMHNNLCSYFDLPIQHVSANVLKSMGRRSRRKYLISLFENIRSYVYGATLRTTVMVGFPGETDDDFMELLHFLDVVQFDNVGAFTYSDSEDLASHVLPNHVDAETALRRYDTLMSRQLDISRANLRNLVGKTVNVLVESSSSKNLWAGRSMMQAPEVDGITYIRTGQDNKGLAIGSTIPVTIVDSLEYDLIGEADG